jgi:hypothetical protein
MALIGGYCSALLGNTACGRRRGGCRAQTFFIAGRRQREDITFGGSSRRTGWPCRRLETRIARREGAALMAHRHCGEEQAKQGAREMGNGVVLACVRWGNSGKNISASRAEGIKMGPDPLPFPPKRQRRTVICEG